MLRHQYIIFASALSLILLFGCNTKSHIGGDDAGTVTCGTNVCTGGDVCCNESCGICAAPGEGCITLYCLPDSAVPDGGPSDSAVPDGGAACGPTTCEAGQVCCNASCGICTAPGESCPAIACTDAGPRMSCGGAVGDACTPEQYCSYPDGCGGFDIPGTCEPRPEVCPTDCPGVCGCDGSTYCNDCDAASSGTDVLHPGPCATPSCAAWDAAGDGICDAELGFVWDGRSCVSTSGCACVGRECSRLTPTLEECETAMAGCLPPTGTACGGLMGLTCGPGEFCDYPEGSFCGGDDSLGVCQPRPGPDCIEIFAPVCGCDGVTYDNGCFANAAGVDFSGPGRCGTDPGGP